jgi:hypothetical protein
MKANSKTQSDTNLNFDGMAGDGVNRGANRFAKNQWSGHSNDGRLVNVGRGPTKGNQDYNGMQGSHREPPTAALPAFKTGKEMTSPFAQVRNPSGTKEMPNRGKESFNFGRGPTKGNQQ